MKVTALTTILLISISFTYAQTKDSLVAPWWVEKFRLSAGLFVPVNNTKIQVEANGSVSGTDIDFQKDLGLNSSQLTFMVNFQWRISRRSRIDLTYYDMNRNATHKLDKDITFKGETYHINSTVNSYFNTAIYQFSYGYAFIEKPTYEVGVLIGAHTVGTKAGISLEGSGTGINTSNNFGFTAPLPDLGIWGGYAFSDQFAVNLDFDYLALTINNVNGRLVAYDIAFSYKLLRQLNVMLGYSGLNFSIKTTKNDVSG